MDFTSEGGDLILRNQPPLNEKCICGVCGHESTDISMLEVHLEVIHGNIEQSAVVIDKKVKEKSCHLCSYITSTNQHLKMHIKAVHHKIKDKICDSCEYATSSTQTLKRHTKMMHNGAKKKRLKTGNGDCKLCDFQSISTKNLRTHMKDVHDNIKDQICSSCDFKTSNPCRLKSHIKVVHNKVKDHMCSYCGFATSHREGLKLHIKAVHHKIRDKICDMCGYAASHDTLLKQHIKLVHDTIKDKICDTCGYKTNKKQNLQAHIKAVHKKLKDSVCSLCGYGTSSDSNLKKHMKIVHHKIKDKVCNMCGHSTSLTGDLRKHMRVVHKVDMKTPRHVKYTPSSYQDSNTLNLVSRINVKDNAERSKISLVTDQKMDNETGTDDCNISNGFKNVNDHENVNLSSICDGTIGDPMHNQDEASEILNFNTYLNCDNDNSLSMSREEDNFSGPLPQIKGETVKSYKEETTASFSDIKTENDLIYQDGHPEALEEKLFVADDIKQETDHVKIDEIADYLVISCAEDSFPESKNSLSLADKSKKTLAKRRPKNVVKQKQALESNRKEKANNISKRITKNKNGAQIENNEIQNQNETDEGVKRNCEMCPYATNRKGHLRRHIKSVHYNIKESSSVKDSQEVRHSCDVCKYVTTRIGHLRRHIKSVHYKAKDKSCDLCSYATSDEGNLKKHIKAVHEKIKDQVCDVCGFATTDFSGLKKHIREVHDKIKDKVCSLCGFTTARNAELKHHIKGIHDKIKDKICETCGYATTDNSNLRKHIRKVHNKIKNKAHGKRTTSGPTSRKTRENSSNLTPKVKNNNCNLCSYSTDRTNNLKQHFRAVHKISAQDNNFILKENPNDSRLSVSASVNRADPKPEPNGIPSTTEKSYSNTHIVSSSVQVVSTK